MSRARDISPADLMRRDLKHADDRRNRASELEEFAKWMDFTNAPRPFIVTVPQHKSWSRTHAAKTVTLTKMQTEAFESYLIAEAERLYKYADTIEKGLTK